MNFSTKTEYGLRALVKLDPKVKTPVSLAQIARSESISLAYLERLFALLKKAKIVRADLGVGGGYYLARPAKDISVLEIVEVLEGKILSYACVKGKVCAHSANCKVHPVWQKLYKEVRQTLGKMKLINIMK